MLNLHTESSSVKPPVITTIRSCASALDKIVDGEDPTDDVVLLGSDRLDKTHEMCPSRSEMPENGPYGHTGYHFTPHPVLVGSAMLQRSKYESFASLQLHIRILIAFFVVFVPSVSGCAPSHDDSSLIESISQKLEDFPNSLCISLFTLSKDITSPADRNSATCSQTSLGMQSVRAQDARFLGFLSACCSDEDFISLEASSNE